MFYTFIKKHYKNII